MAEVIPPKHFKSIEFMLNVQKDADNKLTGNAEAKEKSLGLTKDGRVVTKNESRSKRKRLAKLIHRWEKRQKLPRTTNILMRHFGILGDIKGKTFLKVAEKVYLKEKEAVTKRIEERYSQYTKLKPEHLQKEWTPLQKAVELEYLTKNASAEQLQQLLLCSIDPIEDAEALKSVKKYFDGSSNECGGVVFTLIDAQIAFVESRDHWAAVDNGQETADDVGTSVYEILAEQTQSLPHDRKDRYFVQIAEITGGPRYHNVIPPKHSAVEDLDLHKDGQAAYHHANKVTETHIAAQGPLVSDVSVNSLWRLAFEQNANAIVNLTRQEDECGRGGAKNLTVFYWPKRVNDSITYAGNRGRKITVTTKEVTEGKDKEFAIIKVELRKDGVDEPKTVTVCHYKGLPDHNTPTNEVKFDQFYQKVRELECTKMVVHCKAGMGRTGLFICWDQIYQGIQNGTITRYNLEVELKSMIWKGRKNRGSMFVQEEKQCQWLVQKAYAALRDKEQKNWTDAKQSAKNELANILSNRTTKAGSSQADESKHTYVNVEFNNDEGHLAAKAGSSQADAAQHTYVNGAFKNDDEDLAAKAGSSQADAAQPTYVNDAYKNDEELFATKENRDTPVKQHSTDILAVPPVDDDITDFDFEARTFTRTNSMSSLNSYNAQASHGSSRPSTPSETSIETDVSNFKPEYPNAPLVHTTSLKSVHGIGPYTSETTVDVAKQSEDESGYESGGEKVPNLEDYQVDINGAATDEYKEFKKQVEKGGELFNEQNELRMKREDFKVLIKSLPLAVVRALTVARESIPETLQGKEGDIARYAFYEMVIDDLHNTHPDIDLSDELKNVRYFNHFQKPGMKHYVLSYYEQLKGEL